MSFSHSSTDYGFDRPRLTGLWITAILIVAIFVAGLLVFPPQFDEVEGAPPVADTVLFLGRFHPILVHLPVGILMFLVALELACFVPSMEARYGPAALLALVFGSAGAVFAVLAGIMLAREGGYGSATFTLHQALGILGTAGILAGLFLRLKGMSAQKQWLLHAYRVVLMGAFAVMGLGAHFGANMVHGSKYLTQYAPQNVKDQIAGMEKWMLSFAEATPEVPVIVPSAQAHDPKTPSDEGAGVGGGPLVFQDVVLPILEAKCNACHNAEKSKGDLRMDTFELAMQGGESGDNIIPGKPDDSLSVFRIMLPPDDDEHMPPDGKDQMTAEELALFRWWIEEGASNTMTVKDATIPEAIQPLVNEVLTRSTAGALRPSAFFKHIASVKAGLKRSALTATAAVLAAAAAAPSAEPAAESSSTLAEVVTAVEKTGASLLPLSAESDGYRFTALNVAKQFNDEGLAPLAAVAEQIISLDLARTQVTDNGLSRVGQMKQLKELRLDNTGITDAGLEHLTGLKELEYLNLYGSRVTDAGIQKLAALPKLRALYLWQTGVTKAGVAQLHGKLPQASINIGWNDEDNAKPVAVAAVAVAKTEDKPAATKPAAAPVVMAKLDPAIAAKADVFEHVVSPILASKCVACHGEEKTKGKLKLDTFANIMAGGSEGDVNVIGGKSGESLMIQRILLPHDDDEHMPPEDEPQITTEELALLKWWIDGGAVEKQKLADAKTTPEIEGALAVVLKDGLPDAPKMVEEVKAEGPTVGAMTEADKKQLADITVKMQALNATLMPLAQDTELLRLSVINAAGSFGDKELVILQPLAKWIVWLDLARSKVTDAGMVTIAGMPNVQRLHLENTAVSDAGISKLASLKGLEYLNLYGTKVTDKGIGAFAQSPKLQKLYVWQTGVTKAAAKDLEGKVKGLTVNVGLSEAEIAKLTAPPPAEPKKEAPAKTPAAAPAPKANPAPAKSAAKASPTKAAVEPKKEAPKVDPGASKPSGKPKSPASPDKKTDSPPATGKPTPKPKGTNKAAEAKAA